MPLHSRHLLAAFAAMHTMQVHAFVKTYNLANRPVELSQRPPAYMLTPRDAVLLSSTSTAPASETVEHAIELLASNPLATVTESASYDALVPAAVFVAIVVLAATLGKLLLETVVLPALLSGATLKDSVPSTRYVLGARIGRGSYGSVYRAKEQGGAGEAVVIKEINLNADVNARDFAAAELYFNQKLRTVGQLGKCAARFVGHFNSLGADPYFSLVFKDEGSLTLADALRDKAFPRNVAAPLGLADASDGTVVRRVAAQIFGNLATIHAWSVVHRDVKGDNLLLSDADGRFKLLDFGVACDLASKTNYRADLQPFDPSYCPPEAPPIDRGGDGGLDLAAGGRFDVFSAGLLLAQMVFPPMRSEQGIQRFKAQIAGLEYDLDAWRDSSSRVRAYDAGFDLLDQHGGWTLLKDCLRREPKRRISAAAAAASRFCRA